MAANWATSAGELAFWGTVVAWGIGERVLTVGRDRRAGAWRSRDDAGSYQAVNAGFLAAFVAGLLLAGVWRLPAPWLCLVAGLATAWAGIVLRWWAIVTLGELFTTRVMVRQDQPVVSRGPYGFVRHPSYLGLLLLMLGLGLALGSAASALVMVAVPAATLVRRIRVEEAVLLAGLGAGYDRYCRGRARLLPGIW